MEKILIDQFKEKILSLVLRRIGRYLDYVYANFILLYKEPTEILTCSIVAVIINILDINISRVHHSSICYMRLNKFQVKSKKFIIICTVILKKKWTLILKKIFMIFSELLHVLSYDD